VLDNVCAWPLANDKAGDDAENYDRQRHHNAIEDYAQYRKRRRSKLKREVDPFGSDDWCDDRRFFCLLCLGRSRYSMSFQP